MRWNISNPRCVTCQYWGGGRTPIYLGRYAEAENSDNKGGCWHPESTSKSITNKNPTDTCPKWEAWKVLV
jgi:hypothetical protein